MKKRWSRLENRLLTYSMLIFTVYLAILVFFVFFWKGELRNLFSPFCVDFGLFYAAGKMTLAGQVAQIFDVQAHHAVIEQVLNLNLPYFLPWLYPPFFLIVIAPFAFLPFHVALILWLVLTFALMIAAAVRMLPKRKELALMLFGFPGVLMNLRWGQNGFFSAALLGGAIATMETNPLFCGVMVGLLCYKPQMALLPALMLLFTKNWKALLSAAATAATASLVSLVIFGKEVWLEFFSSLFQTSSSLMETASEVTSSLQPVVLTALKDIGVDSRIGLAVQIVIALGAIITVCWVFRNAKRMPLKGAALTIAMPLIIPYFMQYDLAILGLALVLLVYDLLEYGNRKIEIAMVALLWFMPLVNSSIALFTMVQICPPVLMAEMVMIVLRIKREATNPVLQLSNPAAANSR